MSLCPSTTSWFLRPLCSFVLARSHPQAFCAMSIIPQMAPYPFFFFFSFFCQNMLMALNKYWAALTQQLFSNFFWQATRCSEFSWSPLPPPQRLPRQGVHSNDVVPFDFHTCHWVVVKVSSSGPRRFHSSQSLAFKIIDQSPFRPKQPSNCHVFIHCAGYNIHCRMDLQHYQICLSVT